jgi:hypothetical protein
MTLILGLLFAVAGFLYGFGDGGRGRWSPHISSLGGLVWLGAVIAAFVVGGWKYGLLALLVSFVVAALTMPLGRGAVNKLRTHNPE